MSRNRMRLRMRTWWSAPWITPGDRTLIGSLLSITHQKISDSRDRIESGETESNIDERYDLVIETLKDTVELEWTLYEAPMGKSFRNLFLPPIPRPVALKQIASYRDTDLTVMIRLVCPAYDLFAGDLREHIEEAWRRESQWPLHSPISSGEFTDQVQDDLDFWQGVLDDTKPLHRPSQSYRAPKRVVHSIAESRVAILKTLLSDRGADRIEGGRTIIPPLAVRIETHYDPSALTDRHKRRFHRSGR